MFVALCILQCNAHAPYCHLWPAPLHNIFPHYLINGHDFRGKKFLIQKCLFWVFSTVLSDTFFILRRIQLDTFTIEHSCSRTVHVITNHQNNQQDALYRLIYYSKSALHVLGDVFAHHQEHLTVFTASVHPSCCRLAAGSNLGEHYHIL